VGFVPTGVLENLVDEGQIPPSSYKIINSVVTDIANTPFPEAISTPLFPQWAFMTQEDVPFDVCWGRRTVGGGVEEL
jgi:hypothetical protein